MEIKKLNVMIPTRDRTILTEKCIDSIWRNSEVFERINIYVYDNNSDITQERVDLFTKLLKNKKIHYYSFDTNVSTMECFGKVITFNRWIDMMKMEKEISDNIKQSQMFKAKNYYMLLDNDFILGPRWGEYFVTACDVVRNLNKDCKFLVKFPGGIPGKARTNIEWTLQNPFREGEIFKLTPAGSGGASGMWFMDYNMLMDIRWDNSFITTVFNITKRHDTNTWNGIRSKFGPIQYVVGIIPPNNLPIALHMGSQTGSICNELKRRSYDLDKENIKKAEEKFKDMSCDEIFDKYKTITSNW